MLGVRREVLGPPVDLTGAWRLLNGTGGMPPSLLLFGSADKAERFFAGLPGSKERADQAWHGWWGAHGTAPPYAQHGGPFNADCFVGASRDCAVDPQPLPPPAPRRVAHYSSRD